MNKLLLVGCGNIGFRHLQAILNEQSIVDLIYIVEKNIDQIHAIKNKISCIKFSKKVLFYTSFDDLRADINYVDIAISSVTSQYQIEVIKKIVLFDPKYILLEKPLSQSYLDCLSIFNYLSYMKKNVYVNLTRPMWNGYQNIYNILINYHTPIRMNVSGLNWGFGCNALHYIDLFRFLTNSVDLKVEVSAFKKDLLPPKRGINYEDFSGSCLITNSKDDSLELSCFSSVNKEEFFNISIRDSLHQYNFNIIEALDFYVEQIQNVKSNINELFVSTSTYIITNRLIETGVCMLPNLDEALISHKVFFDSLQQSFNDREKFFIT